MRVRQLRTLLVLRDAFAERGVWTSKQERTVAGQARGAAPHSALALYVLLVRPDSTAAHTAHWSGPPSGYRPVGRLPLALLKAKPYSQTLCVGKCGSDKMRFRSVHKGLEGLKQAGHSSFQQLNTESLLKIGFKQLESEPTIFVLHRSMGMIVALVWIDDYAMGVSSDEIFHTGSWANTGRWTVADWTSKKKGRSPSSLASTSSGETSMPRSDSGHRTRNSEALSTSSGAQIDSSGRIVRQALTRFAAPTRPPLKCFCEYD